MLRHVELYNPIDMTQEMTVDDFTRYVNRSMKQKGPTDKYLVMALKKEFFDTHSGRVSDERLKEIWEQLRESFEANEGLTYFALDWNGAKSEFFFPWLINVHASPSKALEMSYGWGDDLNGVWRKAPVNDSITFFVKNDPTFVYNRERQLFVADLATSAREVRKLGDECKVVDLGAGRLAWVRRHGFTLRPLAQKILAIDSDPTIDPATLFMDVDSQKPVKLKKLGIEYKKCSFLEVLNTPECANVNLFILGGVASYFPMMTFVETTVKPIHKQLKDNGVFFFDLQLDCPYYQRSMRIFSWPEMKLHKTAQEAIGAVEQIRSELWKAGMRFSAEYKLDTYNEFPTSVMIVLTKV